MNDSIDEPNSRCAVLLRGLISRASEAELEWSMLGARPCFAPTQAQHGQRDGPRRQHDAQADCTDEKGQRREQH